MANIDPPTFSKETRTTLFALAAPVFLAIRDSGKYLYDLHQIYAHLRHATVAEDYKKVVSLAQQLLHLYFDSPRNEDRFYDFLDLYDNSSPVDQFAVASRFAKFLMQTDQGNSSKFPTDLLRLSDEKEPTHTTISLPIPTTETTFMNKFVDRNVDAGRRAIILEGGRMANEQLAAIVSMQVPDNIRAYVRTPIGAAVLANLFDLAVTQFAAKNPTTDMISAAMLDSAMYELARSVDVPGLVSKFTTSLAPAVLEKITGETPT
jgi:hypothetical protein